MDAPIWLDSAPHSSSLVPSPHVQALLRVSSPTLCSCPVYCSAPPETGLGNLWLLRELLAPPCSHTQYSLFTISTHTVKIIHFISLWVCLKCPFHEAFLSPPTNEASILYKDLPQHSNSLRVVLGGTGLSQTESWLVGWPIRPSEPTWEGKTWCGNTTHYKWGK